MAFFRLKTAASYGAITPKGRFVTFLPDKPTEVTDLDDVVYFEGRPDLVEKCTPTGISLNEATSSSPRSYTVLGASPVTPSAPVDTNATKPEPAKAPKPAEAPKAKVTPAKLTKTAKKKKSPKQPRGKKTKKAKKDSHPEA